MSTLAKQTPGSNKLQPGPRWSSFEQFRKAGEASLDEIAAHMVGTLIAKRGTYRVMREADFQELYGLTAEFRRFQNGLNVVVMAARAYAKNSDKEHTDLLLESIMLIANAPVLPTQVGHEAVAPAAEDPDDSDDFNWDTAEIPRPEFLHDGQ